MADNTAPYGWDASMGISLHDKIRQDMKTSMVKKRHRSPGYHAPDHGGVSRHHGPHHP